MNVVSRSLSRVLANPVEFEVIGMPAPQGSKTRMPNGVILEGASAGQRARHKNWRSAVADTARDVAEEEGTFTGPLHVSIAFRFPMPASRPKAVRLEGECWKVSAPDIDKLARATLDGLVAGGLILDDRLVVELHALKSEVLGWTGASVFIGVMS